MANTVMLKQQPYNLLLLTSIVFFVGGLFGFNVAIDIHLHDSYFVFRLSYFIWALSLVLITLWFIYLVTKKALISKSLIWIHILLTILTCVFILTAPNLFAIPYEGTAGEPRRYYDICQSKTIQFSTKLTGTATMIFLILIIGQITYFINLFMGLHKGVNRQNNR